jgi:hypothetical protein
MNESAEAVHKLASGWGMCAGNLRKEDGAVQKRSPADEQDMGDAVLPPTIHQTVQYVLARFIPLHPAPCVLVPPSLRAN